MTNKPAEDKAPQDEEKVIKEPAPQPNPKPTRASTPRTAKDPLEQTVTAFVAGLDQRAFADRLLTELRAVGIESIEDLGPHRLGDVNQAVRAALRADAHAFYAAAADYRGD